MVVLGVRQGARRGRRRHVLGVELPHVVLGEESLRILRRAPAEPPAVLVLVRLEHLHPHVLRQTQLAGVLRLPKEQMWL